MLCEQPIDKGAFRIAVERELEVGSNVTRGAGYLHPRCAAANLENIGGTIDELIEALRANSKLDEAELDGVIADIEEAGDETGAARAN